MSPAFTWTNVIVYGCLTVYVIFPWLLSRSSLNKCYVVGMLFACAYLSPWHTSSEIVADMALILFVFFRLPAVIMCTRTSLVLLCNTAFVALTVYRAYNEDLEEEGTFGSAYVVLWIELSTFAITLAFSVALRSLLARKVEYKMQQANAETQFSAASTLLSLMCDAVVELDESFCLRNHSKALAAMLLKSSDLQGLSFLDLMPSVDATRADEHLRTVGEAPQRAVAHAFHTRLVDSCSTKLEAEVFQVKYTQMNGEHCHLVGVREFSDHPPKPCDGWAEDQEDVADVCDSEEVLEMEEMYEVAEKGQKTMLEVDMKEMKIHAASAPLEACVGLPLQEIFASPTIQLFCGLHTQAVLQSRGQDLPGKIYYFKEMPMSWTREPVDISGSMQLMRSINGSVTIMVSFSMPRTSRMDSPVWDHVSTALSCSDPGSVKRKTSATSL